MPPPHRLAQAQNGPNGFWRFITQHYRDEVWLVAPKHYKADLK